MSWAERWAEREWAQTERRIVRRLKVLERRGAEMSNWALFAHFMASYRDLLCMVICLRVFREHGGEE